MGTGSEQLCSADRELRDRLREIVISSTGLKLPVEAIADSTDLYRAGMSSQGSVMLMVAVEAAFGIEFPDAMLSRDVFRDIDTIAKAIGSVQSSNR